VNLHPSEALAGPSCWSRAPAGVAAGPGWPRGLAAGLERTALLDALTDGWNQAHLACYDDSASPQFVHHEYRAWASEPSATKPTSAESDAQIISKSPLAKSQAHGPARRPL
jgi:hypothetical protein